MPRAESAQQGHMLPKSHCAPWRCTPRKSAGQRHGIASVSSKKGMTAMKMMKIMKMILTMTPINQFLSHQRPVWHCKNLRNDGSSGANEIVPGISKLKLNR